MILLKYVYNIGCIVQTERRRCKDNHGKKSPLCNNVWCVRAPWVSGTTKSALYKYTYLYLLPLTFNWIRFTCWLETSSLQTSKCQSVSQCEQSWNSLETTGVDAGKVLAPTGQDIWKGCKSPAYVRLGPSIYDVHKFQQNLTPFPCPN